MISFFLLACAISLILAWNLKTQGKKRLLQILLLGLLLVCFYDITWQGKEKRRNALFLLDISDSVRIVHKSCSSDLKEFYERKISHILSDFSPQDYFSVLFFADGMQIALPWQKKQEKILLPGWEISGPKSMVNQALESFAWEKSENWEVFLFTDGNLSPSVIEKSKAVLDAKGKSIYIFSALPANQALFADVCIESMVLPPVAYKNSHIAGYLVIKSSMPGVFHAIIESRGEKIYETFVKLEKAATTRVYFSLGTKEDAFIDVSASLKALSFEDGYAGNNFWEQQVRILGEPSVCLVGERLSLPYNSFFLQAHELAEQKEWKKAGIVVIAQGQASALGKSMESIQDYVFSGGSLLVLGHENTLGQGGYSGTPLEKALPVLCSAQDKDPLNLMLLLDVSGSMEESIQGKTKLQEAKEAIAQILPLLNPVDSFSLVSFRDKAERIFPMQPLSDNEDAFWKSMAKLHAKGGTNIANALRIALEDFQKISTKGKRHLVLISDGMDAGSQQELFRMAQELTQYDISFSIIATAKENIRLLENLAKTGKGRFYPYPQKSLSFSLLEEMGILQKDFIKAGNFLLQTLSPDIFSMPLLYMQSHTLQKISRLKTKAWGKVLLESQEKDPVLILGHYGMGRSAVFAGNFTTEWRGNLSKKAEQKLLGDILSWLMPSLHQEIEWQWDFQEQLVVQCTSPQDHKQMQILPSWDTAAYNLQQKSPDQYQALLPIPPKGKHFLLLQDKANKKILQYPLYIPYEQEYRNLGQKSLHIPLSPKAKESPKDITPWILALALLLFLWERIGSGFILKFGWMYNLDYSRNNNSGID